MKSNFSFHLRAAQQKQQQHGHNAALDASGHNPCAMQPQPACQGVEVACVVLATAVLCVCIWPQSSHEVHWSDSCITLGCLRCRSCYCGILPSASGDQPHLHTAATPAYISHAAPHSPAFTTLNFRMHVHDTSSSHRTNHLASSQSTCICACCRPPQHPPSHASAAEGQKPTWVTLHTLLPQPGSKVTAPHLRLLLILLRSP